MAVGESIDTGFRYKGILIRENTGRPYHVFQCRAGDVVANIPDKINRSAKNRLCAYAGMISITTSVFEHPDIVYSPLCLHQIIGRIESVVAIKVNGNAFLPLLRQAL